MFKNALHATFYNRGDFFGFINVSGFIASRLFRFTGT